MSQPVSESRGRADSDVPRYVWYALAILALVYMVNFVDRQILSILAQEIKRDLGVSDAQLGFLYGTAFAVFYAVFGIPLARLSDVWVRKNVIALGLAVWSLMTALSGTARSFPALGIYRVGVGVGEASATPAAYSMLTDYFPQRLRATALSIYAGGLYVGQGLGLFVGGWIVDTWNATFDGGVGWLGIRGWQAAFLGVGLPGLLLAVWVWRLREPRRGQQEGIQTPEPTQRPWTEFGRELAAVIPPFTLFSLIAAGAGRRELVVNALLAAVVALVAAALISGFGAPEQWISVGLGVYASLAWAQGLALRDPPAFSLLFGSRAMRYGLLSFGISAFTTYAFMFWTAPFLLRAFEASATQVGFYLAIANIAGGGFGVVSGGLLSDLLKRRFANGRVYVVLIGLVFTMPLGLALLYAPSLGAAFAAASAFQVANTMWVGSATAIVTELVLPRLRAIATAILLLMYTFIGLALGPFTVGRISDALMSGGTSGADALRAAMGVGLAPLVLAILCLALAARHLPAEERSLLKRARAAGEPLD